jgi:hypothetical protein
MDSLLYLGSFLVGRLKVLVSGRFHSMLLLGSAFTEDGSWLDIGILASFCFSSYL